MRVFLAPMEIQDAGLQFSPGVPALQRLKKERGARVRGQPQPHRAPVSRKCSKRGCQIGFWRGSFCLVSWYQCPRVRKQVMALVPEDSRNHQAFWSNVCSPRKVKVTEPKEPAFVIAHVGPIAHVGLIAHVGPIAHVGLELTLMGKCPRAPGRPALCASSVSGSQATSTAKLAVFHVTWLISAIVCWY